LQYYLRTTTPAPSKKNQKNNPEENYGFSGKNYGTETMVF
jgi:hypothetical protein